MSSKGTPSEGKQKKQTIDNQQFVWQQKKMGDFIEPGTQKSTNIKVKIETQ